MSTKAEKKESIQSVDPAQEGESREMHLDSGRLIVVRPDAGNEMLEVTEPGGQVSIRVRLTDQGPEIVVEGARLELKARDTISLKAETIELEAEKTASIQSRGQMEIISDDMMKVHSDDDVVVTGKIIHLN